MNQKDEKMLSELLASLPNCEMMSPSDIQKEEKPGDFSPSSEAVKYFLQPQIAPAGVFPTPPTDWRPRIYPEQPTDKK